MKDRAKFWGIAGIITALGVASLTAHTLWQQGLSPRSLSVESGKAFLDSQIPPGLAPAYYPPGGFIWAGFLRPGLPEARYGVTSPAANPKGQVVIFADADFPAEAYFDLVHQLVENNLTVWIFEPPGQGGAGRFKNQGNLIDISDLNSTTKLGYDFINTVVRPSKNTPLYIIGNGSGVRLALRLRGSKLPITKIIALDPHINDPRLPNGAWHRDQDPAFHWGHVGHLWQIANPDLRLREKSPHWHQIYSEQVAEDQRFQLKDLNPLENQTELWVISLDRVNSKDVDSDKNLCAGLRNCRFETVKDQAALSQILLQSESKP